MPGITFRSGGNVAGIPDGSEAALAVIDPHAHFYERFGAGAFLDAARDNLSRAAVEDLPAHEVAADLGLVLLDIRSSQGFSAWRDGVVSPAGWQRQPLAEDPAAVRFINGSGATLTLIGGRQLVSAEGLEVVVIGTVEPIDDGRPVRDYLQELAPLWPVMLPWGVGKWLGRRGRLLQALIADPGLPSFLLGDNAGRPALWRDARRFGEAQRRGLRILPGSDPLPIRHHAGRVGRSGCWLPLDLKQPTPSGALVAALRDPEVPMQGFGRQSPIGEFVRDQVVLRLDRIA
jgi:hypothetical protein